MGTCLSVCYSHVHVCTHTYPWVNRMLSYVLLYLCGVSIKIILISRFADFRPSWVDSSSLTDSSYHFAAFFYLFFFCEQKGLSVHNFFLSGKTYLKLSMRFYVFCFVLFFLHVIGNVRMKSQANDDVPWELKVIGYGINWGYFRVFRKSNAKTKIKWVHFHLLVSQCIESDSLKILQIIS